MQYLLFFCFAALLAAENNTSDFRKATWGMSQAQVLASESGKPGEIRQSEVEVIVHYDALPARA